ncbi:hypothetical protein ACSFBF_14795 [Variovorax sp. ZT5P49]|uniref:hypothetical protein n=1 Tax=Variovorax sp. ZT5P49 TaxID=3443733 RepID=UPI003F445C5F
MEYVVGAVIASILIFFSLAKKKTDSFNKLSRLPFPAWHSIYSSSNTPETIGIARALILQTFHLATELGVLSQAEKKELGDGSMKENPAQVVNGWFEIGIPNVLKVVDEKKLLEFEARLVGVLILITLKGVNPEADLRRFLEHLKG